MNQTLEQCIRETLRSMRLENAAAVSVEYAPSAQNPNGLRFDILSNSDPRLSQTIDPTYRPVIKPIQSATAGQPLFADLAKEDVVPGPLDGADDVTV